MDKIESAVEFPEIWTTKDGRKLRVSDMDEHHVRAALNMVIRGARKRAALLKLQAQIAYIQSMTPAMREMMDKHDIGFGDDNEDAWGKP